MTNSTKTYWSLSSTHSNMEPIQNFQFLRTSCIFLSKKPLPNKPFIGVSKTQLCFSHQHHSLHKPVTSKISTNQQTSTISYLINSCGLLPETASLVSQKVHLQNPEKANSVLALLRKHGFSQTQISNLIRKRPLLLLADPENTLLPKLEFFHSIGASSTDLARVLTADPTLLTRSLENQIVPCYNFLKSVLLSDKKIVTALKRTSWIFLEGHTKNLIPNISFLRELGVPESCIVLLLTHFPEALMQKHDNFGHIVNEVKEMGFDPMKSTFVLAIHAISGKGNKSIWERCYEVYRRWGWSKDEILLAFRKHPHCMILSEKKIMKAMDFFVNKMGWPSKMIAKCPVVLLFSLERRIVPRCSVIQVLSLKGLVKKDMSLTTVLLPVEESFLERFVTRFQEEIPQLMSVYQGKVYLESII